VAVVVEVVVDDITEELPLFTSRLFNTFLRTILVLGEIERGEKGATDGADNPFAAAAAADDADAAVDDDADEEKEEDDDDEDDDDEDDDDVGGSAVMACAKKGSCGDPKRALRMRGNEASNERRRLQYSPSPLRPSVPPWW
jgi:hypothetical protein